MKRQVGMFCDEEISLLRGREIEHEGEFCSVGTKQVLSGYENHTKTRGEKKSTLA